MVCSRKIILTAIVPLRLVAAIENVQVAVTHTQAVISYTAPSAAACFVEASESPGYVPLVHDVDTAKFPESNLDTRPGAISEGRRRVFVAGKRSADVASDGKRYSRALQAATTHYYRITCASDTATGIFRTRSIPFGLSYNDPVPPGDSRNPGWPTISWTNRNEKIVDPHTGALLRRITLPRDTYEAFADQSVGSVPAATNWTNPDNVRLDDSAVVTYSGSTSDWLFVPANASIWQGGSHGRDGQSVNYLTVTMNAWCSGADCGSASAADRTLQVCLTTDRVSCGTNMLEQVLAVCTSGCTGDAYRFVVGNTEPILAAWTSSPAFDIHDVHKRSGTVNTDGTVVTWAGGNSFSLKWAAGSSITINSVEYAIQSVDNERQLTLASSAGTQSGVAYSTSNFGFLIRKKTNSTHEISVQYIKHTYEIGGAAVWDTAGDTDVQVSCSPVLTSGPGGESGYHCAVSMGIYWIGAASGTVTRVGKRTLPSRSGIDGWNYTAYCDPMWDKYDGNVFYCGAKNSSGSTVIVKATYNGSNGDPGPARIYDPLVECGSPPCWTLTNLTPESSGSLSGKVAAFSQYCNGTSPSLPSWKIWGAQDKYLLISRTSSESNDVLGCMIVFDSTNSNIVAAKPSWKHYPTRWSVLHGTGTIGYRNLMFYPSHWAVGGSGLGRGIWRSQITSGAVGEAGEVCPDRPEGHPIPASEWPAGNNCLQVTVAGEPCDPDREPSEPTDAAKCGGPGDGYVQDAEVRDVFCGRSTADACDGLYSTNEYFRLLVKNGITWTVQRKYGNSANAVMKSLPADSYLVAAPPSCGLNNPYACASATGYWDFVADPVGSLGAFHVDRTGIGTGHGTIRPGGTAWSAVTSGCLTIDGQDTGCYATRVGDIPGIFDRPDLIGPSNPPFASRTAIGAPNEVDGHPSQPHYRAATNTFFDARPFLGHNTASGSSASPAANVTGDLWKFGASQVQRLRRKILPTLAACGPVTLADISGPAIGDVIGGASSDAFKYCVAQRAGECRSDSSAGDVYVNCPQATYRYCAYPGPGGESDVRNMCVTDNGPYNQGVTETYLDRQDLFGRRARLLTHALSRYRWTNIYWNVKSTPLGEWAIVVSPWAAGQRSEAFLAKLPPVEGDSTTRSTFVPVRIKAGSAPAGADRLMVQFGYNANFNCTGRAEACYAISDVIDESSPFKWASELANTDGDQSSGGWSVDVPAVAGRTLYYRVVWRSSANGNLVHAGPAHAIAVP